MARATAAEPAPFRAPGRRPARTARARGSGRQAVDQLAVPVGRARDDLVGQRGRFARAIPMRGEPVAHDLLVEAGEAPGAARAAATVPATTKARRRTASAGGAAAEGTAAGEAAAADETSAPEEGQPLPAAGACPRCGREVRKDSRGWTCGTEGCVRLPRYLCGKVIDASLAGSLLTRGRTPLITGFKSPRTGRSFSSYLVLADDGVRFEFPPDRPRRSGSKAARKAAGSSSRPALAAHRQAVPVRRTRPTDGPFPNRPGDL